MAGDPTRLVYGLDSVGFTCGTTNTYLGVTYDLSDQTELYYVNYLELLESETEIK
jgi:hypothetical protein